MDSGVCAGAEQGSRIIARLERLPFSRWHMKIRSVVGLAWFFDAFDALAIAYILPVLIGLWHLTPMEIGGLIAVGYAGQALGSVLFGWLAERVGRVPCAIVTIAIFAVMSLVCATAWSFQSLMLFRFAQGLGLGGEVPIMHTYVNEFAKAEQRGRFTLLTQLPFPIGLVAVALVGTWVVPAFGWQWMFIIGAVPAVLTLPLRWLLPESPRWLVERGRIAEADAVVTEVERIVSKNGKKQLPPIGREVSLNRAASATFADLFSGIYRKRTLVIWALWFCTYLAVYGLSGWLPSIYRGVYHLSVQQSLQYGLIASVAGLVATIGAALLIDVIGRKALIAGAMIFGGLPMLFLLNAPSMDPKTLLGVICFSFAMLNASALSLGIYNAENYPTRMRALGSGVGGAWVRIASMVGPYAVGFVLPYAGVGAVFMMFGIAATIGGLVCLVFAIETKGQVLEDISPIV